MSLKKSDRKLTKMRGTVTIKEASFDEPPSKKIQEPPLKLENRIENFKNDPEQMKDLEKFINDILEHATIEAERKQESNKTEQSNQRSNSVVSSIKNGRITNRARGFIRNIYDVIRNCANSEPVQRIASMKSTQKK